jgi:hypothetical protein
MLYANGVGVFEQRSIGVVYDLPCEPFQKLTFTGTGATGVVFGAATGVAELPVRQPRSNADDRHTSGKQVNQRVELFLG